MHEAADIDGPVLTRDVRDGDVEAAAIREHRVHEGGAHVDASPRPLKHPLDEAADLSIGEHRGRELAPTLTGDEHLARSIDPDLFDIWVVEEPLQGSEAGDVVKHAARDRCKLDVRLGRVVHLRDESPHGRAHQLFHRISVSQWIQTPTPHRVAHISLDDVLHRCRHFRSLRSAIAVHEQQPHAMTKVGRSKLPNQMTSRTLSAR